MKWLKKILKIKSPSHISKPQYITFKEFSKWCSERYCDGNWGATTAMYCVKLCETMHKLPARKREEVWRRDHAAEVQACIVESIDKKIKEVYGDD